MKQDVAIFLCSQQFHLLNGSTQRYVDSFTINKSVAGFGRNRTSHGSALLRREAAKKKKKKKKNSKNTNVKTSLLMTIFLIPSG